ncbi:MAG: metallophosphoesterase [Puniceicoccaceae bacterium]
MPLPHPDQPILIIPDVHQNHRFITELLSVAEAFGPLSEIIFLGDFLDAKEPRYQNKGSVLETLTLLCDLLSSSSIPVSILWGNHDWQYWICRSLIFSRQPILSRAKVQEIGLQYDTLEALRSRINLPSGEQGSPLNLLLNHAKLTLFRHGYVLSHAGFAPEFWISPSDPVPLSQTNPALSVDLINQRFEAEVPVCSPKDQGFFSAAGFVRGGDRPCGGPLWLDWNHEFDPEGLPYPQIVGHTRGPNVRQKGGSYCLDAGQSAGALLYPDQKIAILPVSSKSP